MNKEEKSTIITTTTATAVMPSEHTSIRQRRSLNACMVQNFLLVWLDSSIDPENNNDCKNTISKLKEVVSSVNTFTDADECIDFINDLKQDRVFMIVSGTLGQTTIPIIHEMLQLSTVFIFCANPVRHEEWAKKWPKIKGIFTDIALICKALQQAAQECDQNMILISFITTSSESSKQSLDQLDSSFMYTQIMKEILLTINFQQHHIDEFLTYCRDVFANNPNELYHVNELQQEYHKHLPIWWYTYDCFLHWMLNRSLRTMEARSIIRIGFFIRDLHDHIAKLHAQQFAGKSTSNSFIVYRGQGLSKADFDQLIKSEGGLLSFNSFISTTMNLQVSLEFARKAMESSDLIGILFVMKIDPSIASTSFADICDVSYCKQEAEMLFSMHSIFRVGSAEQMNENSRLWQVNLTLSNENDPDLHVLTEYTRDETKASIPWLRLAKLMIKLAQYTEAEDLCKTLLTQGKCHDYDIGNIFYQLGVIKFHLKNYAEALKFFEKSLQIRQKQLSSQHPDVADCYNDIAIVHDSIGDYSKALSSHQKAQEIYQTTLYLNHPQLATSYHNIGVVYNHMDNYSNALSSHQKALKIRQATLPSNHPQLATSYSSLGSVYDKMGDYSNALSCHQKALAIRQKVLPSNHPSLAVSYNDIASLYYKMGDYTNALSHHQKTLEINQKSLPLSHFDLIASYNNIASVYDKMGDYPNALSFHQKTLEIHQKVLPSNHPQL
ncbi:unnamed protein product, partial [Rotaria sp. Silwood2]